MKYKFDVRQVSKETALSMIQKYHYSNTLPKINKYFLGFYYNNELVGIITLGYGTRPLHTIKKLFNQLETKDYLEIGRMCMTEEMPRNSESQMLSACRKWIKANLPSVKILFTWADGMLGKVGYVYQASNFIYAGYVGGEMYMKDGIKIHVRQMKSVLLSGGAKDKRITIRPTIAQMQQLNIEHYKGKQYRYFMFLCSKQEEKELRRTCNVSLTQKNPKDNDLWWKTKNVKSGKWEFCDKPKYVTDIDSRTIKTR